MPGSCWTVRALQLAVLCEILLLGMEVEGRSGSAVGYIQTTTTETSTAASSQCLRHCVCKWRGGKESVSCGHLAGLTEIPASGLDKTVQVLDLSGNALNQLVANQFRKLGLFHLQRVILQRCSLRSIDPTALSGLTNLVELDLSHNVLTAIPGQAFERAPELRELKLNGNPLVQLNSLTLTAASKLVRLELANCQISQVEPKAFQGLELLEWLRLDGNLIEYLPTATFSSLRSLRGVDLHHNPWNCTCLLRPLRSWLAARNMPFSVPPLCLSPVRLRGMSWNRLTMDELACTPQINTPEPLVQVMVGQRVTLSCQVLNSPEAKMSWFFGDKEVANSSSPSPDDGQATTVAPQADQQLYFIRETRDKSEKHSYLTMAAAREQDSGFYICKAVNLADNAMGNITLVVRANPMITDGLGGMGRGMIAGILLAVFALLVGCLLVCCFCSLKRARLHSALRNRRPSAVFAPSSNGGELISSARHGGKLSEQLDPLFERARQPPKTLLPDERMEHNHVTGNGVPNCKPSAPDGTINTNGRVDTIVKADLRLPEKQWHTSAVQHQPDGPNVRKSDPGATADGHRPIALYSNNKVTFNPTDDTVSASPSFPSPASSGQQPTDDIPISRCRTGHYPDLVEASGAGDEHSPSVHEEEADVLTATPATRSIQPYSTAHYVPHYRSMRHQPVMSARRRLSDWELSNDDDDSYLTMPQSSSFGSQHRSEWIDDPELFESDLDHPVVSSTDLVLRRQSDDATPQLHRHSFDDDDSFRRRYAYHTSQLNQFLLEYRTLQRRLARMQDTWNQQLEADPPVPLRAQCPPPQRVPLRPILKNRSSSSRHRTTTTKTPRWADEEEAAARPPVVELADDYAPETSSSVVEHYYS